MAGELVEDELCEIVPPLLPAPPPRKSAAGRKRLDQRRIFTGIVFILQTGLPWELLTKEIGCGSGHAGGGHATDNRPAASGTGYTGAKLRLAKLKPPRLA